MNISAGSVKLTYGGKGWISDCRSSSTFILLFRDLDNEVLKRGNCLSFFLPVLKRAGLDQEAPGIFFPDMLR